MKAKAIVTSLALFGATAAMATVVDITFHGDNYVGSEGSADLDGEAFSFNWYSDGGSGSYSDHSLDLGAGTYTLTLYDSWGDGWSDAQWGGTVDGSGAAVVSIGGEVVLSMDFGNGADNSGFDSVSGSFTVPAPGALALLGLAGLTAGRRRRA